MSMAVVVASAASATLSFLVFWLAVGGTTVRAHSCGEGCSYYAAPGYLAATVLGMAALVFSEQIAIKCGLQHPGGGGSGYAAVSQQPESRLHVPPSPRQPRDRDRRHRDGHPRLSLVQNPAFEPELTGRLLGGHAPDAGAGAADRGYSDSDGDGNGDSDGDGEAAGGGEVGGVAAGTSSAASSEEGSGKGAEESWPRGGRVGVGVGKAVDGPTLGRGLAAEAKPAATAPRQRCDSAARPALGIVLSVLVGVFSAAQYGVIELGKRAAFARHRCGGNSSACPPDLLEAFNNFGSWLVSFGIGALVVTSVLLATMAVRARAAPDLHWGVLRCTFGSTAFSCVLRALRF